MRRCPSVPHDLDTSVDPTRHGTALLAASTLTRTRRHRVRRSQHGTPFNPFPAQESVLLMQPLPKKKKKKKESHRQVIPKQKRSFSRTWLHLSVSEQSELEQDVL